MPLPREIKEMLPLVVNNIKTQTNTDDAWLCFVEGAITATTGFDRWYDIDNVVEELIKFLTSSDRVTAVIAAMILGSTDKDIANPAVRTKAIQELNKLQQKWVKEKPVMIACAVSMAELHHPPAERWRNEQRENLRAKGVINPVETTLKKIVVDYIVTDNWK